MDHNATYPPKAANGVIVCYTLAVNCLLVFLPVWTGASEDNTLFFVVVVLILL